MKGYDLGTRTPNQLGGRLPNVVIFLALVLVGIAPSCFAQAGQKISVVVEHAGIDDVGQQLAFELRELIRGSQGMRLVVASEADPRVVAHVVTAVGLTAGKSTATSVSVVYDSANVPLRGYFMTSSVQICGSTRTHDCARSIVAEIDAAIQDIRKSAPSLWNQLR